MSDFAKRGINTDIMPWELPAGYLTELNNVRINRQKISPFGGFSVWFDGFPSAFDPGFIMHSGFIRNQYWIVAGIDKVYVYDGSTLSDLTIATGMVGVSDPDAWTGDTLSSISVINNPGDYPQWWDSAVGVGIPFQHLPWDATNDWDDVNEQCRILRSHKQYLFALDLISNGQEIPDGVRWSTPADINSVPESWDPLDTTKVAGITNLGGNGGRIIDGQSLRDAFVVYREKSISIFDFIGGNFVWQIRHQSTTIGLVSRDALVEVKGLHYFIGDGDVLVNDGNSIRSLMHNRLRKKFVTEFNSEKYFNAFAVKNNILNEIWFCIPVDTNDYPTRAYIYNWLDDSWAIRDLPEIVHAAYGSQTIPGQTWTDIPTNWSSTSSVWNTGGLSPLEETVIGLKGREGEGDPAKLLFLDKNDLATNSLFNTVIERIGYPLEGYDNVTTITRVYPHMAGPGACYIQVGSMDHPGAPVRWKPPVLFDADIDRKVDIRTTGELHCFRVYANDVDSTWDLSGFDIEYVNAGGR